jgi:hypothetical protein
MQNMRTTTLEIEKIEQFVCLIPSFPESIDASFFEEDKEKLFMALHEKELKKVCGNDIVNHEVVLKKLSETAKGLMSGNNNINDTFKKYIKLEQEIESGFSGNQYIYVKQRALSVKALYYYKIKNFQKALVFTIECNALIEYLLHQGMYTLSTRCFEQNKNISRVYFRNNQIDLGNKTANSLMCYLFNGEYRTGLFGSIFYNNFHWSKNTDLREFFAYEAFTNITENIVRSNLNNNLDFLPNEWYIDLNFELGTPERQLIHNWISINKYLKNGNYDEYFDSLISFFQQAYNKHYDILKISLMIDFTKFLHKLNLENKEFITGKINDFFTYKIICNKSLYNLWISSQASQAQPRFLF